MTEFRFTPDDPDGRYWLGRQHLVSVTEVIGRTGLIYHAGYEAMERGRIVAQCCHLLNRGKLDWQTVDERLIGWVVSYQKAVQKLGWIAKSSEVSDYERAFLFAGTYDVEFESGWLIDNKAGVPAKWHKAQLGGYWKIHSRHKPMRIGTLYLKEDGSVAHLQEHNPWEAWGEFQTILNFYRLKERYGINSNSHTG